MNVEDRKFNDFEYSINCDKLKNMGWSEKIKFSDSIKKNTIEWYKNNKSVWKLSKI